MFMNKKKKKMIIKNKTAKTRVRVVLQFTNFIPIYTMIGREKSGDYPLASGKFKINIQ